MADEAEMCADFTIFNLNIIDGAQAQAALHGMPWWFSEDFAFTLWRSDVGCERRWPNRLSPQSIKRFPFARMIFQHLAHRSTALIVLSGIAHCIILIGISFL